jgi:hypothetical protein
MFIYNMTKSINISNLDIDYILGLPEVINAKERIDLQLEGSVYFNIDLKPSLRELLCEKFGLDFSQMKSIPMRWIKGDTKPHIDRSSKSFDNTYLAYLTDSQGQLLIDGESYPISKGNAYIFSEGLPHETIGTCLEPRLLLGPMSEQGLSVGGPYTFTYPGGTIIYIRNDTPGFYEFSLDQSNWSNFYFPAQVTNTDSTSGVLIIEFTTDISVNNYDIYFICTSHYIQFGSTSLKNDGTRPRINIEDVNGYLGFINNGTINSNGYNDIYIFNLEVRSIGTSILQNNAGWIGQEYFGRQAQNNYIVNCFSDGDISENGGGIVGNYAGVGDTSSFPSSSLFIIGCSSQGEISVAGGCIVGSRAGSNGGYVRCNQCWSTGSVGDYAGGIFGQYAADSENSIGGEAIANNCYSTGSISIQNAGGIFGHSAGISSTTTAQNCYSQGAIYGDDAGANSGTTYAINCYSLGNDIYVGGITTGRIAINCYVANGNWNDSTANANLTGIPNPVVGTTWVSTGSNIPYELNNMGYTPYTIANIVNSPPTLNQSYSQNIFVGTSSSSAIRSSLSYNILQISGGNPSSYGTITMNSTTGAVSTTNSSEVGMYTISLRNTGSYNITTFSLLISNICFLAGTLVTTDQEIIAIEKINPDIHTIHGKKIVGITQTISSHEFLICFEKHALGNNKPSRKTHMTHGHEVFCNGKMRKAIECMEFSENIYKVKYRGEVLYNVLMERHETMEVNNLQCETLNPENPIAKLYNVLKNCSPEEQKRLAKEYNEFTIKNNKFTSKQLKHLNKCL